MGRSPAGDCRTERAVKAAATTLFILVKGRFRLQFPDLEILLSREGDYALWLPGVPHYWSALEDSTIVTVRWPSLSGDSSTIKN